MFPLQLQTCPRCKEPQLKTIESRPSDTATRRRKECGACGHRVTVYEVPAEFYNKAKENEILLGKFRKLLGGVETQVEQEEFKCPSCKYDIDGERCSFDLPEYNTIECSDCTLYERQKP